MSRVTRLFDSLYFEQLKDDSFAKFNKEHASTEEISKWVERFIKPLVQQIFKSEGLDSELEMVVEGDVITLKPASEAEEVAEEVVDSFKVLDDRIELRVESQFHPEKELEKILDLMGISAAVSIEDDVLSIECDPDDYDYAERVSKVFLEKHQFDYDDISGAGEDLSDEEVTGEDGQTVSEDEVPEDIVDEDINEDGNEEVIEDETTGAEDDQVSEDLNQSEMEEMFEEAESAEEVTVGDKINEWVDTVIRPQLNEKFLEVGIPEDFQIKFNGKDLIIDLSSPEKTTEEFEEQLEDSLIKLISDSNPDFNVFCKLNLCKGRKFCYVD